MLRRLGTAAAGFGGGERFRLDLPRRSTDGELARDVCRGLLQPQKSLPPKYFYDDRGMQLFDAICELPEYYLTRTEHALLQRVAPEIARLTRPSHVIELGSGASRKTRVLLDALRELDAPLTYVPLDVNAAMLRDCADALLRAYPALHVHAIAGDYERDLDRIPAGRQRLVLFLGSTIGNLSADAMRAFLINLRRRLRAGDHFLLGVDLAKAPEVLEAAYDDAAGVTAEFNRNILHVINRALDGTFDPERFAHVAFFNHEQSQIEMHLRARVPHSVSLAALGLTATFRSGETIHTEISRKFTRPAVDAALSATGFDLLRWYTPPSDYFALALACAC